MKNSSSPVPNFHPDRRGWPARSDLDGGSPPLLDARGRWESARGRAQSKTWRRFAALVLPALATFHLQLETAHAQGTAFTYQGRLNDNSAPADGLYDLRFKLFVDPLGNNQAGSALLTNAVAVNNGAFIVTLDFGAGTFNGSNYWLEVDVKTNGAATYVDLSPLQPLTPVPYAIFAENASGGGLAAGVYTNAVTLNNAANQFTGTFAGNGAGLTNVSAATLGGLSAGAFWQLGGNAGTAPGVNFLGTADNQPLELRVNGQRAWRLLPDASTNNAPDIVGGSPSNALTAGQVGTTIGGGSWNTIGPAALFSTNNPYGDFASYPVLGASYSTIGGGFLNEIQSNATFSTVAGGALNTIQSGDVQSTIGGGFGNTILSNASWSIIAGGTHHTIGSQNGFIGGGWNNAIQTNSGYSAIAGGLFNGIRGNAADAFIGGGYDNVIGPDGMGTDGGYRSVIGGGNQNAIYEYESFIGGGLQNLITAGADHSVIGGGQQNVINGSVGPAYGVIGGGQGNVIQTNTSYAVIGGGYGNLILSNATYAVIPGGYTNVAGGSGSLAAGTLAQATNSGAFVWSDTSTTNVFHSTDTNQFLIRAAGGVGIGTNRPAAALHVVGGGGASIALRVDNGGVAVSGAGVGTPTAAFVQVANSTNIILGSWITTIFNPLSDNDPNALLFVTHNWNPPGVVPNYETHPFSVYYYGGHWNIYNDDIASITNMSFNVLIIKR
ncbi:MAG: hypothetical protein KGJ60_11545 [Verrucomicrobiota bacterium]|nr:hypothetical protein [Verrucomicrobiota bacterium]